MKSAYYRNINVGTAVASTLPINSKHWTPRLKRPVKAASPQHKLEMNEAEWVAL
jgi:hypothetical protein